MKMLKGWFALALAIPAIAPAEIIELRRNTVLEATSDQDLNVKNAREGDRFTATVSNDRELPRGSQLLGEILRIEQKRGQEKAFMDVEFRAVRMPDGSRHENQALPISLDNKNISRGRDGRLYADAKKVKSEYYVIGGLVGGLILGSVIKKPFEGAFVGTLAGIILGEAERQKSNKGGDLVLRRGSRFGAVVLEDASISYNGRWDRYDDRNNRDDRYGRDDRYNRDDRYRNDDVFNRDDRFNDRFDIKWQNRSLRFDRGESPYAVGRTIMVPLRATSKHLGLRMDRTGDRIYLENDEDVMRLTVGERSFRYNGSRRGDLDVAVEEKNGQIYVPLEALAPLVSQPLFANGIEVRSPA